MGLADIALLRSYRTGRDDLLKDFYIPVLSQSIRYDRAVGFFSSSLLSHAVQGVSAFFGVNRGEMRLVFGGELSVDDYDAAMRGERQKAIASAIEEHVDAAIDRMVSEIDVRRLDLLSLLVALGRLKIKFALRGSGMFHDKFGLFYDAGGSVVGFDGSANESAQAFLIYGNWERIRTYKSWDPEQQQTIGELQEDFAAIWEGRDPTCVTLDLPEANRQRLVRISSSGSDVRLSPEEEWEVASYPSPPGRSETEVREPAPPTHIEGHPFSVREHQRAALLSWQAAEYLGIAELCTGAGKTIMAAYAIVKLLSGRGRLAVVISVPYIALAEQWCDVLGKFSISGIRCWSGNAWQDSLAGAITAYASDARSFMCAVVVNATLSTERFQMELRRIPGESLMFVGDECHHHRSQAVAAMLPTRARYRLGLSATPFHYVDDRGNERLRGYYGPRIAQYDLRQALADGVLTPYDYFPCLVVLTPDELVEYRELSSRIAQLYAAGAGDDDDEFLQRLLGKRAELLAVATNKEIKLAELLAEARPKPLTLIYCGIDSEGGADGRQIERVARLLSDHDWTVSRYTSKESQRERRLILEAFRNGFVDALVAMRCLDEGVDIPGCSTAYMLASASDPRQFIQRRGRVLRRAPGKQVASIYDFVVTPGDISDWTEADRRLISRELARVREFADTARNRSDAIAVVLDMAVRFDLAHLL